MKKMIIATILVLFPLIFGIGNAQQTDICRLNVEWAPPGFYANDQCIDIGDDPINISEQNILWYQFRAKPEGATTWTIVADGPDTSAKYSGLPCTGNYEVEVASHFEGQKADCPVTAIKTLTAPRPGSCTILP